MYIHCENYNTLQFAVLLNYELLSLIQKSISILSINDHFLILKIIK